MHSQFGDVIVFLFFHCLVLSLLFNELLLIHVRTDKFHEVAILDRVSDFRSTERTRFKFELKKAQFTDIMSARKNDHRDIGRNH
jgi:hypothetical protein